MHSRGHAFRCRVLSLSFSLFPSNTPSSAQSVQSAYPHFQPHPQNRDNADYPAATANTSIKASPPAQEPRPLFGKVRTLFPQQHGSSGVSGSTGDDAASTVAGGAASTDLSNTRKRKLAEHIDPDGPETDSSSRGVEAVARAKHGTYEVGGASSGGDYFASHTKQSNTSSTGGGAIPDTLNSSRRRASYPFPFSGALPTPATTVSATSGGTGAGGASGSGSGASSERRSSDGSTEALHNIAALSSAKQAGQQSNLGPVSEGYSTSTLPHTLAAPSAAAGLDNSQRYTAGRYTQDRQAVEADTRPGYAFPASGSSGTHQVAWQQQQQGQSHNIHSQYASQPHLHSGSDHGMVGITRAPVPPASDSNDRRLPPAGPAYPGPVAGRLPPDLRTKAGMVFGDQRSVLPAGHESGRYPPGQYPGPGGLLKMPGLLGSKGQPGPSQEDGSADAMGTSPYARSPALKVSHKIAERKRRREMKELFDELRDSIPASSMTAGTPATGENTPTGTVAPGGEGAAGSRGGTAAAAAAAAAAGKPSKWEILAKAVEYISKIQYENQELTNNVIELQRLNQILQEEVMGYRAGSGGGNLPGPDYAGMSDAGSVLGGAGGGGGGGGSVAQFGYQDMSPGQAYQQIPPHLQQQPSHHHQPLQQQPLSATAPNFYASNASPSPGSVHSMPPSYSHNSTLQHPSLAHHQHHSDPHLQTMHNSPLQTPWPISAPPYTQGQHQQSFVSNSSGDATSPAFAHASVSAPQSHPHSLAFPQPPPLQHHSRSAQHTRTQSNPASISHFEHAGSAPPALQHHHSHSYSQSNSHSHSAAGSPIAPHQQGADVFAQPRPNSKHLQQHQLSNSAPPPDAQHFGQGYDPLSASGGRPPSLHSHHSNQSMHSVHSHTHSHTPSHSPQPGPQHLGMPQSVAHYAGPHQLQQQQQQSMHQDDWSGYS